ncbi:MAG: pyridoxal phosphate-dependent decarboxylase family protein, partial [Actinomycetota bacterium]
MDGTGEPALRLDAPREEALARAAKLIEQAWRSFDRFRPEEPPLDDRVRALLRAALPEQPSPVDEVLDDAARILDESIAQPRPRYFAFIGSSGLEIGAIGDALAACY